MQASSSSSPSHPYISIMGLHTRALYFKFSELKWKIDEENEEYEDDDDIGNEVWEGKGRRKVSYPQENSRIFFTKLRETLMYCIYRFAAIEVVCTRRLTQL